MISKCANPACAAELRYLRNGKLFVFDKHTKSPASGPYSVTGRVHEFFWLCETCISKLTMHYDQSLHVPVVIALPSLVYGEVKVIA